MDINKIKLWLSKQEDEEIIKMTKRGEGITPTQQPKVWFGTIITN